MALWARRHPIVVQTPTPIGSTCVLTEMGGVCSSRVQPPAARQMTVPEAFAHVDGARAERASRGAYLFEVGKDERFLLIVEESGVARVRDVRRQGKQELPALTSTIAYKSSAIFFAEARGTLPVVAYLTGQSMLYDFFINHLYHLCYCLAD
ncbi:hypothetical protein T492DRAFT_866881 [Pavlovales sp. CCMP2436]|nr:hypothetical protein T492DRAFT_866881 [Pavlovales sp. CCMP2436]